MTSFIYLFIHYFLFLVSLIPFRISYVISDVVYFFIYHIFGYRKKVVRDNLKLAFPERKKKEYLQIEKAFYHHICDLIFETIKGGFSLSKKELQKRFILKNPEILEKYKNRNIIYLSGHYANWEWSVNLNMFPYHTVNAVYTKIQNKYFENLIKKIRSRFGCILFERAETVKKMFQNSTKKDKMLYIFASDQSPMLNSKGNYWRTFFNVVVPCFFGYQLLAKRLNLVVLFGDAKKVKRGHYETTLRLITDKPKEEKENFIIDKFYDLLEKQIKEKPEYYLWTHRRWKHKNHASKYYNPKKD